LKKAGLEGDMDVLRARAYLDLLLGKDSRPATPPAPPATGQDNTNGEPGSENREPSSGGEPGGGGKDSEPGSGGENGEPGSGGENGENCSGGENGENGGPDGPCGDGPDGPGDGGSPAPDPDEPGIPPTTSVLPAGFAGRINLTVPLATLLDLAERPGEISGLGPIDPALARDLNPATTPRPAMIRPADPAPAPCRGSPSPPPVITGRPAGTAPGGCPPAWPGSRLCCSLWTRSRCRNATTGSRPAATTPESSCGT
jgi:hypothetical protein